jgi:transcriptional antiterminator RfaH
VTVVEPLFPSYLFVRMTLDPHPWYTVKWTPGVKRIVSTGEVPTPVPVEVIGMLRERCGDEGLMSWHPSMRPGAHVQVVYGPFAGLQGILERPAGRGERVRVLLELMGCRTPVEMDATDIELVA